LFLFNSGHQILFLLVTLGHNFFAQHYIFANYLLNLILPVWDQRQKDAIFSLKEMEDTVNDMLVNDARRFLICASAEGTITAIDLNNQKMHVQASFPEEKLLKKLIFSLILLVRTVRV